MGQGNINPYLNDDNRKYVEFIGSVTDIKEKSDIISKAKASILATYYIEPFGNVNIESQLCGTPVITTDWGSFSETVLPGITGYRCRTFYDFLESARNINNIDPKNCHNWIKNNYTLDKIAKLYNQYFQRLHMMLTNKDGWYSLNENKEYDLDINYLQKNYIL
jgi:glycosyltransferase involved in cell wall biosynthesis